MPDSKVHEYRGHFVTISWSRLFSLGRYSGGYLVANFAGDIVSGGQTVVVSDVELAKKLALSLALEAVDKVLRTVDA